MTPLAIRRAGTRRVIIAIDADASQLDYLTAGRTYTMSPCVHSRRGKPIITDWRFESDVGATFMRPWQVNRLQASGALVDA